MKWFNLNSIATNVKAFRASIDSSKKQIMIIAGGVLVTALLSFTSSWLATFGLLPGKISRSTNTVLTADYAPWDGETLVQFDLSRLSDDILSTGNTNPNESPDGEFAQMVATPTPADSDNAPEGTTTVASVATPTAGGITPTGTPEVIDPTSTALLPTIDTSIIPTVDTSIVPTVEALLPTVDTSIVPTVEAILPTVDTSIIPTVESVLPTVDTSIVPTVEAPIIPVQTPDSPIISLP